jgi:hypothetical protein
LLGTDGQDGQFEAFKEGYMIINHNMSAMYANRSLGVTATRSIKNIGKAQFRYCG